jgi:hypothetical protein
MIPIRIDCFRRALITTLSASDEISVFLSSLKFSDEGDEYANALIELLAKYEWRDRSSAEVVGAEYLFSADFDTTESSMPDKEPIAFSRLFALHLVADRIMLLGVMSGAIV